GVPFCVGGQGALLASEILCLAALLAGKDVKKSEVHGMAQRGGSVISQIRIGDKVYSPLIAVGETDVLVSFEKMEALRYAHLLSPEGVALVNNQEIIPVTVSSGLAAWPENLDMQIMKTFPKLEMVPALDIARELKNAKVTNVVMLGALATYLPIDDEIFIQAITEIVPKKVVDLNIEAYKRGRATCCAVEL
ncbi:MAG: indolepyruvate oxidoreductase subunit beta, partial [Armatimonadota bacterium]